MYVWLVAVGVVSSESKESSFVSLSARCNHRPHVAWVNGGRETQTSRRFSPGQGITFHQDKVLHTSY